MTEAQRTELLRFLIFELYYPVGFTNELGPALHAIHSIGVDRLPSWTHRFLPEFHVRLSRSAVSLLRIAIDANQYAVRPRRQSALCTRDNVVNREFFAARLLSTVLATHLVTLEFVSAAEGNLLCRHRIELGQCNDLRDTDTPVAKAPRGRLHALHRNVRSSILYHHYLAFPRQRRDRIR